MPIVIPLSYGLISNEAGNVNPEDMHIIYSLKLADMKIYIQIIISLENLK